MTEPKSYLKEQGLEIPENVKVFAYAGTPSELYLVLPPEGTEFSESDNSEAKMIGRALQDSAYKALLLENPQTAAKKMGVEFPDSMTIIVLQDSEDEMHFVIPANPSDYELSEAELEAVAGGMRMKNCWGDTSSKNRGGNRVRNSSYPMMIVL